LETSQSDGRPVRKPSDGNSQRSPGVPQRLRELAQLRDEGLNTSEEFDSKRMQMLEEL
jgi:hypothetical protein